MTKQHIAVVCGGQSTEHEVSISSAKNVVAALDKNKYEVLVIVIRQDGQWHYLPLEDFLTLPDYQPYQQHNNSQQLTLNMGNREKPLYVPTSQKHFAVDCFFPMLHGTNGEDGTIQGLFELMSIAYVGSGVLSCSASMDKAVAKTLLRAEGIATSDWFLTQREAIHPQLYSELQPNFGDVMFVKPATLGSSVGISKISNSGTFNRAIQLALEYDDSIIVEPCIIGRECEVAVLGNSDPIASLPGEVIPHHDFYSYDAKYLDPNGADVIVPADLPATVLENLRDLAVATFKCLSARGMLRVDFFVTPDEQCIVNEANPIPGFTNISMYPKAFQASGLSYEKLINELIQFAFEHHRHKNTLNRMYKPKQHSKAKSESAHLE